MPQVISLRVPDATAERLRTAACRAGCTLNEWGALSLEEWLRQNEFADIEVSKCRRGTDGVPQRDTSDLAGHPRRPIVRDGPCIDGGSFRLAGSAHSSGAQLL